MWPWLLPCLALVAAPACQGPAGATRFHYGDGVDSPADSAAALTSLDTSLEPLREAFDAHVDVPRVLALMPHMGCERGAAILRSEVLDAHRGEDLRLFVIWQDVARTPDAAQAAARAGRSLADDRVIAFHDGAGLAGRAFARGKLPVAEAREVFLFYPAGARWPTSSGARGTPADPGKTPATDEWVHQLGRVRPEKYCTPGDLPREMRLAVRRLLDQAREWRERSGSRDVARGSE
ncbi:MAG: hypothetical protein VX460_14005 [Planctomycetota bacterium]|nr:hypothetical protein [Planctomycetota bacterium]